MPKQTSFETLTPADIAGRHYVIVKIRPELPQDRMVKAQLAAAYRAPGVDGRPLMDDRTIIENVLEAEYPDTIARRVDAQQLPAQSQEVQKLLMAAREQRWIEDNPTIQELANKRLGEAMNLRPRELEQIVTLAVKQALGAQGAQQLLAAGDAAAAGQPVMMPPGGFGAPQAGGPPGANPMAMPSQMQMTPEEVLPDQNELAASQARRGRPVNPA